MDVVAVCDVYAEECSVVRMTGAWICVGCARATTAEGLSTAPFCPLVARPPRCEFRFACLPTLLLSVAEVQSGLSMEVSSAAVYSEPAELGPGGGAGSAY